MEIVLYIIAIPFGILFLGLPSFVIGMFLRFAFSESDPIQGIGDVIGTTLLGFIVMIVVIMIYSIIFTL